MDTAWLTRGGLLLLARFGVGRWAAWDARERQEARRRVPTRISALRPALTFVGLAAVAVALAVATVAMVWR